MYFSETFSKEVPLSHTPFFNGLWLGWVTLRFLFSLSKEHLLRPGLKSFVTWGHSPLVFSNTAEGFCCAGICLCYLKRLNKRRPRYKWIEMGFQRERRPWRTREILMRVVGPSPTAVRPNTSRTKRSGSLRQWNNLRTRMVPPFQLLIVCQNVFFSRKLILEANGSIFRRSLPGLLQMSAIF